MKTNYNHDSDSLLEGMGFNPAEADDLQDRINIIANKVVKKQLPQTKVAEMLAEQCTEKELIFLAATGVREIILSHMKKRSDDIPSEIAQIKDLDEDALEELSQQGIINVGGGSFFKIIKASSKEGKKLMDLLDPDDIVGL